MAEVERPQARAASPRPGMARAPPAGEGRAEPLPGRGRAPRPGPVPTPERRPPGDPRPRPAGAAAGAAQEGGAGRGAAGASTGVVVLRWREAARARASRPQRPLPAEAPPRAKAELGALGEAGPAARGARLPGDGRARVPAQLRFGRFRVPGAVPRGAAPGERDWSTEASAPVGARHRPGRPCLPGVRREPGGAARACGAVGGTRARVAPAASRPRRAAASCRTVRPRRRPPRVSSPPAAGPPERARADLRCSALSRSGGVPAARPRGGLARSAASPRSR